MNIKKSNLSESQTRHFDAWTRMWQKKMYRQLPYCIRKNFSQRQMFMFVVIVSVFGLCCLIFQLVIFSYRHNSVQRGKNYKRYDFVLIFIIFNLKVIIPLKLIINSSLFNIILQKKFTSGGAGSYRSCGCGRLSKCKR